MSQETQGRNDGQNRCRRCDRPLSNPTDMYGWRCAQIVGGNNPIAGAVLDGMAMMLYNHYVRKYMTEHKQNIAKVKNFKNTVVKEEDGNVTVVTDLIFPDKKVQVDYRISKAGVVLFDFSENDYWAVLWRGGGESLAEAIQDAARRVSQENLSGRTVGGIDAELRLHWAAYKLGIKKENARIANIGGMKKDKPGYDDNAWFFQSAYAGIMAFQLDPIAPGRIEDLLKKIGDFLK